MRIKIIPVTPFQQNCTLVCCDTTGEAALVDPGGDVDKLLAAVAGAKVRLTRLLLTHAHLDHVGAAGELAERFGLPIEGPHRDDLFWFEALPEQCRMFGFPPIAPFTPTRWLEQGDRVRVGAEEFEVLHCPGHTPGHVVFFHRGERLALVGDVLFQGSIGRTDFPRGDYQTLIDSIRNRLLPLGDDVRFVPGHGPMSSFGAERRHNPYVGDRAV